MRATPRSATRNKHVNLIAVRQYNMGARSAHSRSARASPWHRMLSGGARTLPRSPTQSLVFVALEEAAEVGPIEPRPACRLGHVAAGASQDLGGIRLVEERQQAPLGLRVRQA